MTDVDPTRRPGESPPPVWRELSSIAGRFDDATGAVVALDFDGTLAPIDERPESVEIPATTRATLAELTRRNGVEVAVVTGRRIDDVRERIDLDRLSYAGNHGLRVVHDGETYTHPEARDAMDAIDAACEGISARLVDRDGCFVEHKGLSGTVHYRQGPDGVGPSVRATVEDVLDDLGLASAVEVTDGKQILELRPPVDWDKGRAVEWLCERLVPDDERWVVVYVGDDWTDEAAFRAVDPPGTLPAASIGPNGLSVVVGRPPIETAAGYRVRDTDAVAAFLSWLAGPGVDRLAPEETGR